MPGTQSKPCAIPIPNANSRLALEMNRKIRRILQRRATKTAGQQGSGHGSSQSGNVSRARRLISSAPASAPATAARATNESATTQPQNQGNSAENVAISSGPTSISTEAPSNLPVSGIGLEIRIIFANPKRLGDYLVGQALTDKMPVENLQAFICRKIGTGRFYLIKSIILKSPEEAEVTKSNVSQDHQGKSLIHTEWLLLQILKGVTGIVQEHGMFLNKALEDGVTEDGEKVTREVTRMCLVLDCCVGHDFSPRYRSLTNLQLYVLEFKKIPEFEALRFFFKMLTIVEKIHKQNVVHRDLKLANFTVDMKSGEMCLTNFFLGKSLMNDTELLKDQRGSPAYIAPEIIRGIPYLGKPADMWALGVILFTLLYGQFPFYDPDHAQLFRKIKEAALEIPIDSVASEDTVSLMKSLLSPDPMKRPTVSDALSTVRKLLNSDIWGDQSESQVVPVCHPAVPLQRWYLETKNRKRSAGTEPDERQLEENLAKKRRLQMQI